LTLNRAQENAFSFPPLGKQLAAAQVIAKLALKNLYDEPNIFNVPDMILVGFPPGIPILDPNIPANTFNAKALSTPFIDLSGLATAINNEWGVIFTTLNFFYQVYQEVKTNNQLDDNAIGIATALADYVGNLWDKETMDPTKLKIKNMLNTDRYTEIFRRLSGFLAMESGMLKPLLPLADADKQAAQAQAENVFKLNRLIDHLNCNQHYYTQQFLTYIAQKTQNIAIFDFVNDLFQTAGVLSPQNENLLQLLFDVDRTFIDRQEIIVPSFLLLDETQVTTIANFLSSQDAQSEFRFDNIQPTVVDIEVPCDGIHLEVAGGSCVLQGLPGPIEEKVDVTIHEDESLKVNVS